MVAVYDQHIVNVGAATLPGIGKAGTCEITADHGPKPRRYVWHHIQPEACGGHTTLTNLAQLCDNCHYSVHILLWQIANGGVTMARPNKAQLSIARIGYDLCVQAGTTALIPKEG